jgi:hypothetical protein
MKMNSGGAWDKGGARPPRLILRYLIRAGFGTIIELLTANQLRVAADGF